MILQTGRWQYKQGESEREGQTASPTSRKKCIPPSKNIPTIPQQDSRITFKHCILGLTYRNTF